MNTTPVKLTYIVVIAISGLALIGVSSLCFTMFFKSYADPAVLTAIISVTSGLVGSLGSILTNTRTQPTKPPEVIVTNPAENPVQVEPV